MSAVAAGSVQRGVLSPALWKLSSALEPAPRELCPLSRDPLGQSNKEQRPHGGAPSAPPGRRAESATAVRAGRSPGTASGLRTLLCAGAFRGEPVLSPRTYDVTLGKPESAD
ncbi:unnamed protein product [Rangifer tarandus platyrhynchus]|uniref:Uncharacterized protein n=1 Tax=Rangifer tarandus platyrhynchus TaxID=3082113 RepID=A0ABN8Y401_RANTA|nr:unnamed protein product [Rangifer tarandus platyrhynchus]